MTDAKLDTLGKRLRYARKKAGLTLESLGDMVGMTKGTILHIENDNTKNPRRLPELAKAMNVSPAWLQFGVAEIDNLSKDDLDIALRLPELSESQKKILKATLEAMLK